MREYQYVIDHCEAIDLVLHKGKLGEIYNIGTGEEMENMQMVEILLDTLGKPHTLIRHVEDRPGHDRLSFEYHLRRVVHSSLLCPVVLALNTRGRPLGSDPNHLA